MSRSARPTSPVNPSLERKEKPTTVLERLAIGVLAGFLGLLVGLFAWWSLYDVPGLEFGWRAYLYLVCAFGIASLLCGLWRPNTTADMLGVIGEKIWSLSSEVLSWFRFLR